MARRLVLRKETLTQLGAEQLSDVVGAAAATPVCPDITFRCITPYSALECLSDRFCN